MGAGGVSTRQMRGQQGPARSCQVIPRQARPCQAAATRMPGRGHGVCCRPPPGPSLPWVAGWQLQAAHLWLDVAMEHRVVMHVGHGLRHLRASKQMSSTQPRPTNNRFLKCCPRVPPCPTGNGDPPQGEGCLLSQSHQPEESSCYAMPWQRHRPCASSSTTHAARGPPAAAATNSQPAIQRALLHPSLLCVAGNVRQAAAAVAAAAAGGRLTRVTAGAAAAAGPGPPARRCRRPSARCTAAPAHAACR